MADPALPDAEEGLVVEAADSDSEHSNGHDSDDYEAPLASFEPNPHFSLEHIISNHSGCVTTVGYLLDSVFSGGGYENEILKSDQRTGQVLKRITNVHVAAEEQQQGQIAVLAIDNILFSCDDSDTTIKVMNTDLEL